MSSKRIAQLSREQAAEQLSAMLQDNPIAQYARLSIMDFGILPAMRHDELCDLDLIHSTNFQLLLCSQDVQLAACMGYPCREERLYAIQQFILGSLYAIGCEAHIAKYPQNETDACGILDRPWHSDLAVSYYAYAYLNRVRIESFYVGASFKRVLSVRVLNEKFVIVLEAKPVKVQERAYRDDISRTMIDATIDSVSDDDSASPIWPDGTVFHS